MRMGGGGMPRLNISELRRHIRELLHKKFDLAQYEHDMVQTSAKEVADAVKSRLKEMNRFKYKYIVQTMIGQNKGQGIKMANKCFWDSANDYLITEHYSNDSFFAVVIVYIIYHY